MKTLREEFPCDAMPGSPSLIPIYWFEGHGWYLDTDKVRVLILYCPFCGIRLPTPAEAEGKSKS